MTNIRTSGFDSPAQMREYLEEVDDAVPAGGSGAEDAAMERAIRELRGQIDGLRRQLEDMQREDAQARAGGWLRVAATMALTMALGRIARRLKLGIVGAAAVPLVMAQLNRKF
jgi:hypothetical protein